MKFFSLIYQGEVHPATEEKIIPSEDFSTLMQAVDLLNKAKEDAENLHQETLKECQTLKEEAEKRGFQAGLEQFNEQLLNFERSLRALRLELQNQIIPIALKAAKKIVGAQLELNPDTIVDIVTQCLAPVMQNHRFTIYVNKADKEILEAHKPKLKALLEHVQVLTIQERSDISPGGCIIETEAGIINATIENQWRALESAFEKYMK
ncbi:MAG TPA: HrpE/YscL family type III secretion apparatus protein [Rhabdochlamydiaceae bacterium]|jgi:type III secretion protein L